MNSEEEGFQVPRIMEEAEPSNSPGGLDEINITLDDEGEDSTHLTQRTLVGKVISDRILDRGAIKNILLKAWGEYKDL